MVSVNLIKSVSLVLLLALCGIRTINQFYRY